MKIGMLQFNPIVGDCEGNARKIRDGYKKLCAQGAELVVGPELAIIGYPPKDLLYRPDVVQRQLRALQDLQDFIDEVPLIIGIAEENDVAGKPYLNTAKFIQDRSISKSYIKQLLPNYDVFDEQRYFEPGPHKPCIILHGGKRIGLLICEDAWGGTENPNGNKLYDIDPVDDLAAVSPDVVVIINASPYYWGKGNARFSLISDIVNCVNCPVVYVNQVGGNDELIFDGRSFALNGNGVYLGGVGPNVEGTAIIDTEGDGTDVEGDYPFDDGGAVGDNTEGSLADLYEALVLGTRDYLAKVGRTKVVIGESGGIDSALTTCIAVEAVGAKNVTAITMPGPFSSGGSVSHSEELCRNLGVRLETIPIGKLYDTVGDAVGPVIGWNLPAEFGKDVTEENVQARLRGLILMLYSNRTGALVLSTGNKSELAVGYCTLYGDMVGGLAVISDVPKTVVFQLARYVNRRAGKEIIPQIIIDKPPSAELRPDQKDQDSLPDYGTLDKIIHRYVEEGQSEEGIIDDSNLPEGDVRRVIKMIDGNEYKRQQAARGLKVTTKAFGSGRRLPIATKPAVFPEEAVELKPF